MTTFEQQFECRFWDDDAEGRFLRECAQAYHERTEAFDQTLDLTRYPSYLCFPSAHAQSARHAREVRGELMLLCLTKGISPARLDAAIRIGVRHFGAPEPVSLARSRSSSAT